jgi:hypothetical protein
MAKAATKGKIIDLNDVGYDLIVIAGQSNVVGSGEAAAETTYLDPKDSRVFQYPGSGAYMGQIIPGFDPLFHYYGSFSSGPGMPFAREYVKRVPPSRPVLLVPAGRGATGFTERVDTLSYTWDRTNTTAQVNLYNVMINQIDGALAAAGPNSRVAGVIWIQGENDSGFMTQAQYAAKLDDFIDGVRARYGATIPVAIGQMLPEGIAANGASIAAINAAHIDTPRRKVLTSFTYGPSGYPKTEVGGPIHYTNAGLRLHGRQMGVDFWNLARANVLGADPAAPSSVTLTQSGTSVNVRWARTPGRVTDYTVQYRSDNGPWATLVRAQSIDITATITGLTLGSVVDVKVSAVNEEGTSAPSVTGTASMVVLPAQVTGVSAGVATMYSQPLSWSAAAGATGYKVEYKTAAGSTWTTFSTPAGTSVTVTGLAASTSYNFRVSATNAAGTGAPSATMTASTLAFSALRSVVGVAPSAAYSLRQLDVAYAGKAVKVRRSSDNTTLDIGFLASGELDTAALLAFAGAGSAYVDTWYDQSGNALNAVQATVAKQPQIVNAGVVNTINGRPTVIFDGAAVQTLSAPSSISFATGATYLGVAQTQSKTTEQNIYSEWGGTSARYAPFVQFPNAMGRGGVFFNDAAANVSTGGSAPDFPTGLSQMSFVDYGATAKNFTNGVNTGAATMLARGTATLNARYIGTRAGGAGHYGAISEIIAYYTQPTDAQRQAGEANEKAYFGTP